MIVKMSGNLFIGFAIFMRMTMFFGNCREGAVACLFNQYDCSTAMSMGHAPERRDCLEHHQRDDDKTKLLLTDQDLMLWLRYAGSGFGPIAFSCGECVNKV